jgi:hypothetical protein
MQRKHVAVCGVVVCLLAGVAQAQNRAQRVSATLSGDNEVPAVSTTASGHFTAEIDEPGRRSITRWPTKASRATSPWPTSTSGSRG